VRAFPASGGGSVLACCRGGEACGWVLTSFLLSVMRCAWDAPGPVTVILVCAGAAIGELGVASDFACLGCGPELSRTLELVFARLEPNKFPKNAPPMLLQSGALEAKRTWTGFTSVKAKRLELPPCRNESAGGWTLAGIVPEAV
jgi:hypothetical protein